MQELIGAIREGNKRPVRLVLANGRELAVFIQEENNRLARSG